MTLDSSRMENIEAVLNQHEAVDTSLVVRASPSHIRVWVVPDSVNAPLLRRICAVESRGSLAPVSLYAPGPDLLVAQINRTETDFLYRELFLEDTYFRHGIVLPRNACVVDVGANVGMFSVLVSQRSPGCRIIAIEPVEELCQAIRMNAFIHGANVSVLNCALGAMTGATTFVYYPNNTVMSGCLADARQDQDVLRSYLETKHVGEVHGEFGSLAGELLLGETRRCSVMTLSQVVEQEHLQRIDLLKIDVEKSELSVLDGVDESVWPIVNQIVLEVHNIGSRIREVEILLENYGFEVDKDSNCELTGASCVTVFGRRLVQERTYVEERQRESPWLSKQTLIEALGRYLGAGCPDLVSSMQFAVVDILPDVSEVLRTEADNPRDGFCSQSATEGELGILWKRVLNRSMLDATSNFFELGGNSLTAFRLILMADEVFGEGVLTPEMLYRERSLGAVAGAIERVKDSLYRSC
jgi:FkbM family methyltransferase